MKKQNDILFFMVDQLSAKWLEMAIENDICDLPNIKQLMAEGTYFSNAITSNPVCCPTRATIATGLTTRNHGVLENGYDLDPNLPTFMRSLQEAGYRTGAFGKVHFSPHYKTLYPDYKQYGFDVTHITEDVRGGEWMDWVIENHPDYLDDVLATVWPHHMPAFQSYGEKGEDYGARIKKIRDEYDWTTEKYPENSIHAYSQKFPKEVCQTEWITRHALDFIETVDDETPIFAHVSYVQPHSPFNCPEEYLERVDASKIPQPIYAEWQDDPNTPEYFQAKTPIKHENEMHQRLVYFADLIHLDEKLGEVISALKAKGRYDSCNVIFISDHGELLGDHGFYGKEERHYDACIRVPIIVRVPGIAGGKVCEQFIQHEDICPTILEMSGCSLPPIPSMLGPYLKIDPARLSESYGKSLISLCKGDEKDIRPFAYVESYNPIWSIEYIDWARSVRTAEYRYTYYPNESGEQLFNIKEDPNEQHNLAGDAKYAELKYKLKGILLEMIIKQDYPKTRRNLFNLGVH